MVDPVSVAVGAGIVFVLVIVFLVLNNLFKKKSKVDLYNLRKMVYESGIKTREVYKNLLELEKMFKEIEANK